MKKYFVYAMLSAIALTGAVSFSACSSSGDEMTDPNPTFDGEAVKTQFTISFPSNVARANTRQTANTVQNGEQISDFRGMDNIVLYPFASTATTGDPINKASTKIGDRIELKSMILPKSVTVNNSIPAYTAEGTGLNTGSNSVLFNDVTIPIGTGSFLFYGKAIDKPIDSGTDKFYNGSLTPIEGSTPNPANIFFDLDPTYTPTEASSAVGSALASYLSNIAQAGGMNGEKSGWESSNNSGLQDIYTKFVNLKAGSSLTAQAAVRNLYTSIKNFDDATATAIRTAITNSIYASVDGTGVLTFTEKIGNSDDTYFPGNVNLPDGAALLTYDESTNTFSQSPTGGDKTGLTGKYADYVYPASLYYYGNSGIVTSNSSQQSLYNTTPAPTWSSITGNTTAFTGNSVGPSTRSVAILDPIQYAVGRLDATVKLGDVGDDGIMYDKNGDAYAVNADNGFTVTGILIGGQKQVTYDFKPNEEVTVYYTIYDNITKSQSGTTLSAKKTASAPNYTLALETEASKSVFVAVEFLNNGADFQGIDGVVPAGCKFYLVAELNPTNGTQNTNNLNQVFKQDYKTIVNFTIPKGYAKTDNENFDPTTGNIVGLGKAYNTIPDLRTPQLELGLSVDLSWKAGIKFDDVKF